MMAVVVASLLALVTQNRGLQMLANEAVRFLLYHGDNDAEHLLM